MSDKKPLVIYEDEETVDVDDSHETQHVNVTAANSFQSGLALVGLSGMVTRMVYHSALGLQSGLSTTDTANTATDVQTAQTGEKPNNTQSSETESYDSQLQDQHAPAESINTHQRLTDEPPITDEGQPTDNNGDIQNSSQESIHDEKSDKHVTSDDNTDGQSREQTLTSGEQTPQSTETESQESTKSTGETTPQRNGGQAEITTQGDNEEQLEESISQQPEARVLNGDTEEKKTETSEEHVLAPTDQDQTHTEVNDAVDGQTTAREESILTTRNQETPVKDAIDGNTTYTEQNPSTIEEERTDTSVTGALDTHAMVPDRHNLAATDHGEQTNSSVGDALDGQPTYLEIQSSVPTVQEHRHTPIINYSREGHTANSEEHIESQKEEEQTLTSHDQGPVVRGDQEPQPSATPAAGRPAMPDDVLTGGSDDQNKEPAAQIDCTGPDSQIGGRQSPLTHVDVNVVTEDKPMSNGWSADDKNLPLEESSSSVKNEFDQNNPPSDNVACTQADSSRVNRAFEEDEVSSRPLTCDVAGPSGYGGREQMPVDLMSDAEATNVNYHGSYLLGADHSYSIFTHVLFAFFSIFLFFPFGLTAFYFSMKTRSHIGHRNYDAAVRASRRAYFWAGMAAITGPILGVVTIIVLAWFNVFTNIHLP